jgi:transmembrane sensor
MENKQKNIDEVLLLKIIEGRANDAEKAVFKVWHESSPKNKELFAQLKKTYQLSSFDVHSVDANWKQVVDKVSTGYTVPDYIELPETKVSSKVIGMKALLRVAAVIILVIGIGFLMNDIVFSPGQLIVSGNEMKNNEPYPMADGSLVYLHGNSEISFHDNFGKKSREVILKGEAFFEIEKNEGLPFLIKTNHASIKVLGTSFNVFSDMSGQVQVTVVSGVVEFIAETGGSVKLNAEEQGTYHPNSGNIVKTTVSDPNFLSWKTGIMVFKETPVNEAFVTLGQYYNRVLLFDGENDKMPTITTTFDNQPLEAVLEELNLLLNANTGIINDTIIFKHSN